MRPIAWLAIAIGIAAGCGHEQPPAAPKAAAPVTITQFYTSQSNVAKGAKALICYGVENAKSVWLEPPRQDLSVALSRCVEVAPEATTTYTLTAQGAECQSVTKTLTVAVGPPLAKIINVNVTSLDVKPGEPIEICYAVENVRSVTISPLRYTGGAEPKGCVTDQPRQSTTYVVTAIGKAGDRDQERVTVRVR